MVLPRAFLLKFQSVEVGQERIRPPPDCHLLATHTTPRRDGCCFVGRASKRRLIALAFLLVELVGAKGALHTPRQTGLSPQRQPSLCSVFYDRRVLAFSPRAPDGLDFPKDATSAHWPARASNRGSEGRHVHMATSTLNATATMYIRCPVAFRCLEQPQTSYSQVIDLQ